MARNSLYNTQILNVHKLKYLKAFICELPTRELFYIKRELEGKMKNHIELGIAKAE